MRPTGKNVPKDMPGHGQGNPECPPLPLPCPPSPHTAAHSPSDLAIPRGGTEAGRKSQRTRLSHACPLPQPNPAVPPAILSPAHPLTKSPRLPLSPFGPCNKPWPSERGLRGEAPCPRWGKLRLRLALGHSLAPAVFLASPLHIPAVLKVPGFLGAQ